MISYHQPIFINLPVTPHREGGAAYDFLPPTDIHQSSCHTTLGGWSGIRFLTTNRYSSIFLSHHIGRVERHTISYHQPIFINLPVTPHWEGGAAYDFLPPTDIRQSSCHTTLGGRSSIRLFTTSPIFINLRTMYLCYCFLKMGLSSVISLDRKRPLGRKINKD